MSNGRVGIEAIAVKNLRSILHDKGYDANQLFSKFDTNGDGLLSKNEFQEAITSVTGQVAPKSIVDAVFGLLDSDSSGGIDYSELSSLVESGYNHSISDGDGILVSDHPDQSYNGLYYPQPTKINGNNWYLNKVGKILYFYDSASGGANSWSLDDREQDGSNDWYRGGWTRSPSDGLPPLGTRRWVGIGKLTLEAQEVSANGGA